MSENKYEPPKKLRHGVYPFDVMTEYVRADLVDDLVKALEIMIEAHKGEFGSHWGKQSAEETEGHDEVIQARAALAALKEEE